MENVTVKDGLHHLEIGSFNGMGRRWKSLPPNFYLFLIILPFSTIFLFGLLICSPTTSHSLVVKERTGDTRRDARPKNGLSRPAPRKALLDPSHPAEINKTCGAQRGKTD